MQNSVSASVHDANCKTADYWIKKFQMTRHVEGGWFVETYKSDEKYEVMSPRYGEAAARAHSTHIYYIVKDHEFIIFHRLKSDEIWHYHHGATMSLYVIDGVTGKLTMTQLGPEFERFAVIIKRGDWFGGRVHEPDVGKYTLFGATVAPGFEYDDYEPAVREDLIKEYPQHAEIIKKFTRVDSDAAPYYPSG